MAEAVSAADLTVEIWRGGDDGGFRTYRVPRRANQTVLDRRRDLDNSLRALASIRG